MNLCVVVVRLSVSISLKIFQTGRRSCLLLIMD